MIYIFGDSHAEATFGSTPGVMPILVGSITMRRASWDQDRRLPDSVGRSAS